MELEVSTNLAKQNFVRTKRFVEIPTSSELVETCPARTNHFAYLITEVEYSLNFKIGYQFDIINIRNELPLFLVPHGAPRTGAHSYHSSLGQFFDFRSKGSTTFAKKLANAILGNQKLKSFFSIFN